jgi:hypothetical protein
MKKVYVWFRRLVGFPGEPEPTMASPNVGRLLDDIQKHHRLEEKARKSGLTPLHRLVRVAYHMIAELESDRDGALVRGSPSMYAVRDNGDITLWPKPHDGEMPDLYVE